MQIAKEIERAVKRIAAFDSKEIKKPEELETIILKIKEAFDRHQYDFSNAEPIVLTQGKKKRLAKRYIDIYSAENVLCQCVKQILDRQFKVNYPNRNKTIKSLFSALSAARQMSDFTIVKFDFKDYFNSLSAIYVFEKFLKVDISDRLEMDLIKEYVYKTRYTYAGLCTSNALAEIAGKRFDEEIRKSFATKGIIYYERYIDDGIVVLNEYISRQESEDILKGVIAQVFHDDTINPAAKCKVRFNSGKSRYITSRAITGSPCSVDFLGYEFWFSLDEKNKIEIKSGITQAKQKKYNDRLDELIACYTTPSCPDFNDLELLRHRVAAFTSREVYLTKRFRSNIWKVKGFISNYGELRYLLDTDLIEHDTKLFLETMVEKAFIKAGITTKPYFLLSGPQLSCGYNLYGNMKTNRTILLVDHIGYDYSSLVRLCGQIGISNIDSNGKRRGYGTLVREYLIKVKVGY